MTVVGRTVTEELVGGVEGIAIETFSIKLETE